MREQTVYSSSLKDFAEKLICIMQIKNVREMLRKWGRNENIFEFLNFYKNCGEIGMKEGRDAISPN